MYKFPDGKPAIVRYDQEPGSDPDGDPITYLFRIALPFFTGISPLVDGLLTFTRNGNNFEITANEEVSPTEFITVYGEEGYDQASTAIYSSDGTLESGPSEFAITVYYESPAYFDDADARAADQRFIFTDPLETYEGPTAGDDITIKWSAAIRGTRTWGTGNPNNAIACRDTSDTATSHTWPSTGKEDSAQFDAPTTPTTNRSNTITPTFTNEPDFENPADQNSDNIYLVRFYNTHDLHNQNAGIKKPILLRFSSRPPNQSQGRRHPRTNNPHRRFQLLRQHQNRPLLASTNRIRRKQPHRNVSPHRLQPKFV